MADNHPQAGQGRPLPKKEADLFKNVVKHYETKQYKKAIKQSDMILKKFPNHGETLAMKGLTLNNMNKRDEAHALVKQGLMFDMRSHVCWHVYGLLHRAERNYNEAIKAYKQALKIDPENGQILRDLSLLQVQMRDLDGFVTTRNTLLAMKSNAKGNWLSFALAKHLVGDHRDALQVLHAYLGTLSPGASELERGFESSELALFMNQVIGEIPNNDQEALDHLASIENLVMDRGAWLMAKGKHQLQLGQFVQAKQSYLSVFERGVTDDYVVHSGYMCAVLQMDAATCREALNCKGMDTLATTSPLTTEQKSRLLECYLGDLQSRFVRSQAISRIPLTLLEGEAFKTAVDAYCRKRLSKGVPSLGMDLSSLLLHEHKGRLVRVTDGVDVLSHPIFVTLVDLADGYIFNLQSCDKFAKEDETEESPSTILWAWYLRAGLHELANEYSQGINLLDKCLEHTPTAVDVYELKASLLKAAGDMGAAVDCLDKGRDLDKQDRYINNQTCKYMLQAGMEDTALERISLFTKHEGNPEHNLFLMQCSWYELELAACLAKKEKWGMSLKKYHAVVKHFDDFHEDQFDFHSYCIRKVTLRAYSNVLLWEDNLLGQPYYCEAAEGIIKIYLHLYDNPSILAEEAEPDYASMSAADRKKAKALARKKKKKATEDAEQKKTKEAESVDASAADGGKKKKPALQEITDDDPEGIFLFKKDPLEEATIFSSVLSKNASHRLWTWLLHYDVASRRGKGLMALQALFKAKALAPESSDVFSRVVDFGLNSDSWISSEVARAVVQTEVPVLFEGSDIVGYVLATFEKVKSDPLSSLPMRVQMAKALVKIEKLSVSDASYLIVDGGLSGRGVTVTHCREALDSLSAFGNDAAEARSKWVTAVRARFPLIQDWK